MFLLLHYAKKEIKSFCLSQCGAKYYTDYMEYTLDWGTILIWVKEGFLFIRGQSQQINALILSKKDVNTMNAFDRWSTVNRISGRREADAHWAVEDSIRYTFHTLDDTSNFFSVFECTGYTLNILYSTLGCWR